MSSSLSITAVGAVWSLSTGAVLAFGYSWLAHPEDEWQTTAKRVAGGATLTFGMYLWAPQWLREVWVRHVPDK